MKINAGNLSTDKGREIITAALDATQKGCTARTINLTDIMVILHNVEVNLGISKAAMKGVFVTYTGARQFPNSYRFRPESTHFTATFDGRAWRITEVFRATCPDRKDNTTVTLTEAAKAALIEKNTSMRI